MPERIVIAHNIRSIHNVGAIFRTCEGFGIDMLILSGYTPYPEHKNDSRLPHISRSVTERIQKTALGAEKLLAWKYIENLDLLTYKAEGFTVIGLEQDVRSQSLSSLHIPRKFVLLLGEEVKGISHELREECDVIAEIPMKGQKESFNVSVATGIALYALTSSN